MRALEEQDHYEILEIPRGASPGAVERAYRLARTTFADDSLALYSVVDPRDAESIRQRVEEAYRVLSDPAARHEYDADRSRRIIRTACLTDSFSRDIANILARA